MCLTVLSVCACCVFVVFLPVTSSNTEMVLVNCKAVLVLWTTPDEEVVVQVPRDMCAPVNCIVPGLNNVLISTKWSKEALSMRQIIQVLHRQARSTARKSVMAVQ